MCPPCAGKTKKTQGIVAVIFGFVILVIFCSFILGSGFVGAFGPVVLIMPVAIGLIVIISGFYKLKQAAQYDPSPGVSVPVSVPSPSQAKAPPIQSHDPQHHQQGLPPSYAPYMNTMPQPQQVVVQNIREYVGGDQISIQDSVVQRSSVGANIGSESAQTQMHDRDLIAYKNVLKGALADNYISPEEGALLQTMRDQHQITMAEHDAIMIELLGNTSW